MENSIASIKNYTPVLDEAYKRADTRRVHNGLRLQGQGVPLFPPASRALDTSVVNYPLMTSSKITLAALLHDGPTSMPRTTESRLFRRTTCNAAMNSQTCTISHASCQYKRIDSTGGARSKTLRQNVATPLAGVLQRWMSTLVASRSTRARNERRSLSVTPVCAMIASRRG